MKKRSIIWVEAMACIFLIYACNDSSPTSVLSSDGIDIKLRNEGKGTPALVFVHGWSNPKEIWDDQVAHFAQKYHTLAIDLPGFGESGNNRSEWSMHVFGRDVATVVNKLDLDEVILVGFSMGTSVVVEAANQMPDKTIGVVLVDGLQNPEEKLPPEALPFYDSLLFDLVNNMTNEKMVNLGFYKNNQELAFNRLIPMYEDVSQIGWKESLEDHFHWSNEKCIEALKNLKVPLIAINSDMEPTNIEAYNTYVPEFQAKIMTNVGHLVFWDNPEEFNRLLEESIQNFLILKSN